MDNFRAARILTRERPLFTQAPEKWAPFTAERLTAKVMDRLSVLATLCAIQCRAPHPNVGVQVDDRKIEWRRGSRWLEYQSDPNVWNHEHGKRDYDDEEYEPDWMVRVESRWPDGVKQLSSEEIAVAGTTHYEAAVCAFAESSHRALELVAEPTNACDRNAIRVDGRWLGADGRETRGTLGYLPRNAAATLADRDPIMRLHARPIVVFLPRPEQGKGGGIRLLLGWSAPGVTTGRSRTVSRAAQEQGSGCLSLVVVAIGTVVLLAVV